MELNPSQIGQITELKCQTWLLEHGWNVLLPVGNYLKYDLVIEKDNKFYRIQCKHATELETGFLVRTRYDRRTDGKVIKETYTTMDIDYFMTEFKGKYYLFPPFGTNETKFWTVPLKQNHMCKIAQNFYAEDILATL
jgi:hypothetical protein